MTKVAVNKKFVPTFTFMTFLINFDENISKLIESQLKNEFECILNSFKRLFKSISNENNYENEKICQKSKFNSNFQIF